MRRLVLLALVSLAGVLACGKAGKILEPNTEGIVVVRDAESFGSKNTTSVDFENLAWNGSSCAHNPTETAIDNPLTLKGVAFNDPSCLRSGYCSEPTCATGNVQLLLNQDAT